MLFLVKCTFGNFFFFKFSKKMLNSPLPVSFDCAQIVFDFILFYIEECLKIKQT